MATFTSDTFTDTEGTLITAHTGETGATWTKNSAVTGDGEIATNRARQNSTTTAVLHASGSPASAEYDVEAQVYVASNANIAGVIGRSATTNVDFYMAQYAASTGQWRLFLISGGAPTSLGTYAQTLTAGVTYALKLEIRAATKKLYVDGVERISSTNNAVTATGVAGLYFEGSTAPSDTVGYHLASVTAADPAAGATDKSGADTGAGTDATNALAAAASGTDSAAASDATNALAASAAGSDSAAASEGVALALAAADTAAATDATGALAVAASATDSVAAADSGSVFAGQDVAGSDSAAATDATGALAASAAAAETGAGTDAVVSIVAAVAASDSAAATESGSRFAGEDVAASDAATGTDAALALAAAVAATETAIGTDAPAALAAAASATDSAAASEAGDLLIALAGADTAAATEAGSVADVTNIAAIPNPAGAWGGDAAGAWGGGRAAAWGGGNTGRWTP